MREVTEEWVCDDCFFAISGTSSHEAGRELPTPYADDKTIVEVWTGTDPSRCENLADHGWLDHSSCDTENFSVSFCQSCPQGLAGTRHRVTVTREVELV